MTTLNSILPESINTDWIEQIDTLVRSLHEGYDFEIINSDSEHEKALDELAFMLGLSPPITHIYSDTELCRHCKSEIIGRYQYISAFGTGVALDHFAQIVGVVSTEQILRDAAGRPNGVSVVVEITPSQNTVSFQTYMVQAFNDLLPYLPRNSVVVRLSDTPLATKTAHTTGIAIRDYQFTLGVD